jgi:hypothetical protein
MVGGAPHPVMCYLAPSCTGTAGAWRGWLWLNGTPTLGVGVVAFFFDFCVGWQFFGSLCHVCVRPPFHDGRLCSLAQCTHTLTAVHAPCSACCGSVVVLWEQGLARVHGWQGVCVHGKVAVACVASATPRRACSASACLGGASLDWCPLVLRSHPHAIPLPVVHACGCMAPPSCQASRAVGMKWACDPCVV